MLEVTQHVGSRAERGMQVLSLIGQCFASLLVLSHSVMSDSLWPDGLQHARLPYPSPSPGDSSIELVMPSNHFILCHPLLFLPSIFPSIRVFSNELALPIRWSVSQQASVECPVQCMKVSNWNREETQGKRLCIIAGVLEWQVFR